MTAQWIDPLNDPRWAALVEHHPRASVFHTRGWLEALRRTYGYQPAALTTAQPGRPLSDGMLFCRITSWMTGRRLVSLPFSDHCEPLVNEVGEQQRLTEALSHEQVEGRWKYVELRTHLPPVDGYRGFIAANRYCLHRLDLRGESNDVMAAFHKNHVIRKIRRAEREKLDYAEGRSDTLLRSFYRLLLQTRRRHRLPPQPFRWFRAILDCMPRQARVRVVSKSGIPVASILTLCQGDTMIYKYGASDAAFHALGGMHLLLWKTIQDARGQGCVTLDLGRSEVSNEGLVAFKEHWGATRTPLAYWRHPDQQGDAVERLNGVFAQRIFSLVPDRLLVAVGSLLYRHIG